MIFLHQSQLMIVFNVCDRLLSVVLLFSCFLFSPYPLYYPVVLLHGFLLITIKQLPAIPYTHISTQLRWCGIAKGATDVLLLFWLCCVSILLPNWGSASILCLFRLQHPAHCRLCISQWNLTLFTAVVSAVKKKKKSAGNIATHFFLVWKNMWIFKDRVRCLRILPFTTKPLCVQYTGSEMSLCDLALKDLILNGKSFWDPVTSVITGKSGAACMCFLWCSHCIPFGWWGTALEMKILP